MPVHTVWELVQAGAGCEASVTFVIETRSRHDRVLDVAARARGMEGWYRRQWSRALGRLRDLAESGEAPPRLIVAGADPLGV